MVISTQRCFGINVSGGLDGFIDAETLLDLDSVVLVVGGVIVAVKDSPLGGYKVFLGFFASVHANRKWLFGLFGLELV